MPLHGIISANYPVMKSMHRIEVRRSIRLKHYDYSSSGMYYVTVCTFKRKEIFGKIVNGQMCLNSLGNIADQFWQDIPKYYPLARLDEYIVMPNHIHGIIELSQGPVGAIHELPLRVKSIQILYKQLLHIFSQTKVCGQRNCHYTIYVTMLGLLQYLGGMSIPNRLEKNWQRIGPMLQARYDKLSDTDLVQIDGEFDRLVQVLRTLYGGRIEIIQEAVIRDYLNELLSQVE